MYSSTILDLALGGSEWSASHPGPLNPLGKSLWYLLGRMLVGFQNTSGPSGRCGIETNHFPLHDIEHRLSSLWPVNIPTVLSWPISFVSSKI